MAGSTTGAKAPAKSTTGAKVKAGVDAFIETHLRNSDFSRDTAAWNHFQAGIPVLIGAIVAELEG